MARYYSKFRIDLRKLLLWLVIIDILFVPYFSMMSVSYSVPIVVLWMMLNCKKIVYGREETLIVLLIVVMAASTIMNLIYPWDMLFDTSFFTAVKRFFQYVVSLVLLIGFKNGFKKYKIDINKILFAFVLYVFAFSVLYFLFPQDYAALKLAIHPVDNHTRRFLQGVVNYRFNYFWTDPNNVAYAIAGVCTYLLLKSNLSATKKMMVFGCSTFIIVASSSAGGIISILLGTILLLLFKMLYAYPCMNRINMRTVISLVIFIILLFITIVQMNIVENVAVPLIIRFQERMTLYQSTTNITGGRIDDFIRAFAIMNPTMLFVGSGHEGAAYEIGHLYLIGLYGGLAYIAFMKLLFGRFGNQQFYDYIWILPFFIGFTMNIAIGEFKWLAIYILILSYSRYGSSSA